MMHALFDLSYEEYSYRRSYICCEELLSVEDMNKNEKTIMNALLFVIIRLILNHYASLKIEVEHVTRCTCASLNSH